jgi:hypothetical protein
MSTQPRPICETSINTIKCFPLLGKTKIGAFTNFSIRVQKLASHLAVHTKGEPFIVNFAIGFAIVKKS